MYKSSGSTGMKLLGCIDAKDLQPGKDCDCMARNTMFRGKKQIALRPDGDLQRLVSSPQRFRSPQDNARQYSKVLARKRLLATPLDYTGILPG